MKQLRWAVALASAPAEGLPFRPWAGALALAAAALLSACASLAPAVPAAAEVTVHSGRLLLQVEASLGRERQRLSANFELRGQAQAGTLDLASPFGQVLARASWGAQGASLLAADGSQQRHADLAALAEQAFGEPLPVQAWFDWFQGRPWPGAPAYANAEGFEQLGWQVQTRALAEGELVAQRSAPPAVLLRVRFDRAQ